jgi:high-affinity nickel-transport protein
MTGSIIGLHVLGWGMLAAAVGGHYHITGTELFGFGTGILAYTLGMRHAFDADHIAAIDNTTRKLVGEGKRPLSTGFFFSLGHSSVVFGLAVLLNFGIRALDSQVRNSSSGLYTMTGIIGTGVSGTFLYLLAALNVIVLAGIVKVFREMRGGAYNDSELEEQLAKRGLMNRLLGPLARLVDTALEDVPDRRAVRSGLRHRHRDRAAGAGRHSRGQRPAVLRDPLAADPVRRRDVPVRHRRRVLHELRRRLGVARPVRKVYYNLTITGLSVFGAFFVGTIEILGLIGQEFNLAGAFWTFLGTFNINKAGLVIAGIFVVTWAVALSVWHFGKIEQKWDTAKAAAPD